MSVTVIDRHKNNQIID